jgi:hypothetical protein
VDLLHGGSTASIFTILDQPSLPSCFIHIEQIDIPHNIVIAKTNILNARGDFFGAFKSNVFCKQIPSSTNGISRCTADLTEDSTNMNISKSERAELRSIRFG